MAAPEGNPSDLQLKAAAARTAAKAFALRQMEEFKGRGPFFQAKAAVIAVYVVIVLLTLALAPPGTAAWSVAQTRLSFGLSFKTAVVVSNLDNGDLEDVVVVVTGKGIEFDGKERPGTWRTKTMTLPEGLPTKIVSEQLFDERGQNPPYALVVSRVSVLDGTDVLMEMPVPPAAP